MPAALRDWGLGRELAKWGFPVVCMGARGSGCGQELAGKIGQGGTGARQRPRTAVNVQALARRTMVEIPRHRPMFPAPL
jgi:hypothetical protein